MSLPRHSSFRGRPIQHPLNQWSRASSRCTERPGATSIWRSLKACRTEFGIGPKRRQAGNRDYLGLYLEASFRRRLIFRVSVEADSKTHSSPSVERTRHGRHATRRHIKAPLRGGQAFGEAGPYELIEGKLHFAVSPDDPHNGWITDISLAPRNAAGLVEFSSTFRRSSGHRHGGGWLIFDVVNRGNKTITRLNLGGPAQGTHLSPAPETGF